MNLVVGATGMLGGEICRLLLEKNKPVRALVRETSDPLKVNRLKEQGVEILTGDLRKQNSLSLVLKGVHNLFITASSMPFAYVPGANDPVLVDRNGINCLIDEAKKVSIGHIVYTSFTGNIKVKFPLSLAKRNVEEHLQKSGMNYTILRPGYFMEAWLTNMVGFDVEHGKAQVFGDGTHPVSYISYKDVARFAVESLNNPAASNTVLELGGPEKLSQLDVIRLFEEIMHKKFELQYLPVDAIKSQTKSSDDPMQQSFAGLMWSIADGDPIDMTEIAKNFSWQLTSVRDYANSMAVVA